MDDERQALREALDLVGDRWTLLVVRTLLGGPRRFQELAEELPGIAPNILSQRLKQLERGGLVVSYPYTRRPLRLTYHLTARGSELADVVRVLASWGATASPGTGTPRHATCGTPLETRWYCPTCAGLVEYPDESDIRVL
jgi:DNA-binding HxlR family transcriptional regulator